MMPRKQGSGAVGSFLGGRDLCGSEKVDGNKVGDNSVGVPGSRLKALPVWPHGTVKATSERGGQ